MSFMCEYLIIKISRKPTVPFLSGRVEIFAAAIMHVFGTVKFLFDRSFTRYFSPRRIVQHYGLAL